MDIKKYSELKAAGTLAISKVGDDYQVSQKQWVKNSGIETVPIVEKLDIEDLQSRQTFLQKEIEDRQAEKDMIDIIIADCDAL